jgi:omega-hydroxy-beta-dihydromenaquinone-9 sulfotransferase
MVSHRGTSIPVKPILIFGAPGSGTTLLYQTLCSHRDVAYITRNMLRTGIVSPRQRLWRYSRFLGERRKALFILQNLFHRDHASNLPVGDILWIKYFVDYNYMTENDYTEEMATYFRKKILTVQNLLGRPRFVEKTLLNCFRVRLLNSIFPDAKFIHIIRDGRAVAFSILKKIEIAGDNNPLFYVGFKEILGDRYQPERSELYNYGLAWSEFVRKAREASTVARGRYYEVYYENLVREPHNEFKKIMDFCELDWYGEFEEMIPPTRNMNQKWKQKASKEQLTDIEESTSDLMRTLGMAE